jgi:hypothetical protein
VEVTGLHIGNLVEASRQSRGPSTFTPTVWKEVGLTPRGQFAEECGLINYSHMEYDAVWLIGTIFAEESTACAFRTKL